MSWLTVLNRMMGTTPRPADATATSLLDNTLARRIDTLAQLDRVREDVVELDARVSAAEEILSSRPWLTSTDP